ncbi:MAG: aspartate/glutamate racemase family protein [Thermoprotei archaeon]
MKRKCIGIVGGLSPESTILYYKTIVEEYRRRYGNEHYPIIIIYSIDFEEFTRAVDEGRDEDAVEILLEAINGLVRAGADFAVISANTPHKYYDVLVSRASMPILSIIDALAEAVKKDGLKRIGLLGTKYTLTQGFYVEGLRKHGIEAIIPEPSDIELVNRIIYSELVKGVIREESRRAIYSFIDKLVARGAEGVALACTELPLIVRREDLSIRVYDTARIHAIKALEYALSS